MNISRNWLAQYVELNCDLATLCDRLTMAGIEVEAIETTCRVPKGVVVGKILERAPHANSDHLSVCKVFDGKEELQIVCGAPNCDAGKTVPLATLGTVFTTPEGEFAIKKSKIRGVESFGMLCSGKELGVSDDDSGLLILDDALKAGTPLAEVFPGDSMLEIEVTPNRPDWLSHWGVARDVSCLLGTEAKLPALEPLKLDPAPTGLVTVEDSVTCPRYIGRLIRGVTVGESPDWLKERLTAVGLRPINNVVDVTNFILMELGQPLHAFDLDLLAGKRVVVRRARRGESIVTLDGKKVELSEKNLVIADAEKPMALAGVMGGESSGVTAKTVDILLESAIFDAANIRATSRELGISSDSSYRYERGVDYEMADYASDRAAALIQALTGAKSVSAKVDVTPGTPARKVIHCRFDRIRSLVGVEIDNAAIVDIFRKLRLEVAKVTDTSCEVTAPLFRLDLEREADLGEEVARINGLDKVPVRPVTGKAVSSISEDAYVKIQQMRDQLIGFGLFECMHYSMVSEKSALADTRFAASDLVVIDNPLSLELAVMRPSLFGEMLGSIERNISRRNLNLRLFELGRVFCANPELFAEERLECCVVLTGQKQPERFSAELKETYDFYDLKGLLESFIEQRGIENYSFEAVEDGRFAPGMAAALLVNRVKVGVFGLLSPKLTKGWRTMHEVYVAVLDAERILKVKPRSAYCRPVSVFPAVSRDVAFVAEANLEHAAVVEFIRRAGLKNLEAVELFDIFTDEKSLGAGKKSMAYSLTFRNPERTLTDAEVNQAFEKLREKLANGLKVELR